MSNEIANIPKNLPAYAQTDAAATAAAAGLITSVAKNRISLKDAKFIIKKDGEEKALKSMQPIPVVVLGVSPPEPKRTAKVFYESAWNDGDAEAPDCYSSDGVRPDASISEPQCETCAQCDQNAWGSAKKDDGSPSKGKACSDRKILMVALYSKKNPNGDGPVFELSVPPTSLRPLSAYASQVVQHGIHLNAVVTKIGVNDDDTKAMTFELCPGDSPMPFLPEAAALRAIARAASDEIAMMVNPVAQLAAPTKEIDAPDYAKADEVIEEEIVEEKPKKKKAAKKKAAKKEPEPEAEIVDDDSDDYNELTAMLDDLDID